MSGKNRGQQRRREGLLRCPASILSAMLPGQRPGVLLERVIFHLDALGLLEHAFGTHSFRADEFARLFDTVAADEAALAPVASVRRVEVWSPFFVPFLVVLARRGGVRVENRAYPAGELDSGGRQSRFCKRESSDVWQEPPAWVVMAPCFVDLAHHLPATSRYCCSYSYI